MKLFRQPPNAAAQAAASWPPKTVLAMNACLLTQPILDVQRWFEEQVVLHLGYSPHSGHADSTATA